MQRSPQLAMQKTTIVKSTSSVVESKNLGKKNIVHLNGIEKYEITKVHQASLQKSPTQGPRYIYVYFPIDQGAQ